MPHRRALLPAALACAALAFGAAPARADFSSGTCPQADSTRLVTLDDGQGGHLAKLWVFQATDGATHVCFALPSDLSGDLVLGTTAIGGTPTVTPVDATACPVYLHLLDPVDLVLRLAVVAGGEPYSPIVVCFGTGDTVVGVRVRTSRLDVAPGVALWLDRFSPLGSAWCGTVNPSAEGCSSYTGVRVL